MVKQDSTDPMFALTPLILRMTFRNKRKHHHCYGCKGTNFFPYMQTFAPFSTFFKIIKVLKINYLPSKAEENQLHSVPPSSSFPQCSSAVLCLHISHCISITYTHSLNIYFNATPHLLLDLHQAQIECNFTEK